MKKVKRTIKIKPSVERISNGVNSPVRKIVQIAMSNNFSNHVYIGEIIALCNDGSLWQRAVQLPLFKLPMNNPKVVNGSDLMIFRRIKEKITC